MTTATGPIALTEAVQGALAKVRDPASGQDILAAGMVEGLTVRDGLVQFALAVPRERATALEPLRQAAAAHKLEVLVFCAPLEAEIATLDPEAAAGFLKDYGISEPARVRLVQAAYRLLDLISFFTIGPDEVRAWTIHRGTLAPQAAGKVHSDIERGFIRAETVAWEPLLRLKSHAACREQALLRLEGKQYIVQDGDVIDFRFNA